MSSARVAMLMRFLSKDLALSVEELLELRSELDALVQEQITGRSGDPAASRKRTLYLPTDPLDEL